MKFKKTIRLLSCGIALSCITSMAAQDGMKEMEVRAKDLISQMTADEKISQMMNDAPGIERLGMLPYNWWSEALHGVARNGKATVFPQPINLGATFNPELVHKIGAAISDEARAKFNVAQRMKVYVLYAGLTFWSPTINIFRDPRWGRGMETYGEDPFLTSRLGVEYVRGMQGEDPTRLKVAACAKHYGVHSGPEALRHEFDAEVSKKDLFETYLPAFEMLVKEGNVEAIMGAYNRVNGESASGSEFLLDEVLRKRWGFNGHVVSDCGAVTDIFSGHKIAKTEAEAAAIAVKSGLNLECGSSFRALKQALEQNLLTEQDLDKALLPLIMTRLKLGLFDDPAKNPYNAISESVVCSPENKDLARQAATQAMVLLQNKGGILPIKKDIKTLYVTGPYAADGNVLLGNYFGVPSSMVTYLQGITEKVSIGTRLMYKMGTLPTVPNQNPIDWVTGDAKGSDVTVVFLGECGYTEGEEGDAIASPTRGDRLTIGLPEHQLEFLRRIRRGNPNKVVTVLSSGSPIDVREICRLSDAVIWAGYPGQEGGTALADVLFGETSPSGRLPVTFPESVDVLPAFADYSMKGRTHRYQKRGITFPFGYGLTYSLVNYKDVQLDKPSNVGKKEVELKLTLENAGDRAVDEVPQLYVITPGAGETTPLNSLIGFQRVHLKPGEQKVITFKVTPELLKMVDENGQKVLLKGNYKLIAAAAAPGPRSEELGVQKKEVAFHLK